MKTPALVYDFIKKRWYIYVSGILFTTAANLIYANFPRLIGEFADSLNEGALSAAAVSDYGLMLLVIGIGYALLGGIGQFHVMYVGRVFEFETRRLLFGHFTVMSESFYAGQGVGKLLSYFMNDVKSVRESIASGINQTANAVILMAASIYMMLMSDVPLYLIAVSVLPMAIIPYLVVRFGPEIRKGSAKVQNALGDMTEMAEEQFGGIRVTKKFAVEAVMEQRFGAAVDEIRDRQLRLVRISSLFQALVPFTGSLSLIVTIGFGGYLTLQNTITLGNFVALTLYVRMMMNPLLRIGNVINTMQRSRGALDRLNKLLAVKTDIEEREDSVELDLSRLPLVMRNVSFTYPGMQAEALRNIGLTLEPGRTLGIVGRTGSGKTTLVKLLLRIYDVSRGDIAFGGVDIRELTLKCLRENVAYVPQDGFLFSTTIRDNIAFHDRTSGAAEVELASRHAQLYDNIRAFPEQFDTRLGERGLTLSGGQRQRTSLARGLLKQAPLLVLDDSFSAVDPVTEKQIIDALRRERRGKTNIIISHRISAVRFADEIIVLDKGQIVQRGTHAELLARPGLYAELHALQGEGSQYA